MINQVPSNSEKQLADSTFSALSEPPATLALLCDVPCKRYIGG